ARSVVSPDGKYQLSLHGRALNAAAAGDDHPLLSGMVPDVGHRSASIHGVDVFHIFFLSGVAERIVPAALAQDLSLSAVPYGSWHRSHGDKHTSSDGSAVRGEVFLQTHTEISRAG